MSNRATIAALAVMIVFSTTVIGATAFTSATVERDATIDVVTDANGLITLTDGDTGAVYQDGTTGELKIDISQLSGSTGVNPAAQFVFGNSSTAFDSGPNTDTYAFKFTVTDSVQSGVDLEMMFNGAGSATNVEFEVFSVEDSTQQGSTVIDSSNTAKSITSGGDVDAGDTFFVVMTIDTGAGDSNDVTQGNSLGGTITIQTA